MVTFETDGSRFHLRAAAVIVENDRVLLHRLARDGGQASHHEVGLYFRAFLPRTSPLLDTSRSHDGVEGEEKLEFRWFVRSELERHNQRPAILRRALSESELQFMHVVQRGENVL